MKCGKFWKRLFLEQRTMNIRQLLVGIGLVGLVFILPLHGSMAAAEQQGKGIPA
jgi:hypothetical protein